jgi:hypothetical protein
MRRSDLPRLPQANMDGGKAMLNVFKQSQRFAAGALLTATLLLGACATSENAGYQSDRRAVRAVDIARYSVLDDWFWRSRYFDPYYSAFYSGYGVWHDPWVLWSLRTGHYQSPWHWRFDPFYSPWRFGSWGYHGGYWQSRWGGYWGGFSPSFGYYGYPPHYRYRSRYGNARHDRGLAPAGGTDSANRALELLRASEQRRQPDYRAPTTGNGLPNPSAWPTPSQEDRSVLQMERPRRDSDVQFRRESRTNQQRSVFPAGSGPMRESGRRFESDNLRGRQDE